jgi:hypothetical protein
MLSNGRRTASLLLPILFAAGCVSDFNVAGPDQTLWQTTLIPGLEYPSVSGTAAAVSGGGLMEAGITMDGMDPGVYAWRVREGRCDDPGDVVGGMGQYPDIVVESPELGGTESISVQTALFRGSMFAGREYHVDVRPAEGEGRVACGDFNRI